MPKIRFPKSNSLRWVRLQNYSLPESDDTRLYYDFAYTNITNQCYFPKIYKDTLWQQFRTDAEDIAGYLVNENGIEVDITGNITDGIVNPNGTTQYELFMDLSGYPVGKYYFIITFTELIEGNFYKNEFQTEWFDLISDTTDLVKVEWENTSFGTYNDGIIWSQKQQLYIDGLVVDSVFGVEKNVFTTENNKLKTTQAAPIKSKILKTELLPDYILEIINIALQKSNFYVNDVRYNSDGTFEAERQGDTRSYPISITLQVVEDVNGIGYEDYTDDAVYEGEQVTYEAGYILINDTDRLLINATDKLLKS